MLIICDDMVMMIDGGNVADSSLIYSYLRDHNITYIDYMVCSHPDEDHVGGLSGALNYATVGMAFCPVTSYDSKAFNNFTKYLDQQGISITVPIAGDLFMLGSALVEIFGPEGTYSDTNNKSIVLKVTYGETSILFTGDAESEAEHDIIDAGYDLSATVLKAGHHGSDSSTSYVWLREIMPQYAVISVGEGNSYGHPTDAVLSRLRDAEVVVYRTDMQGNIICSSDGKTVSFRVEKNENAITNPTLTDGSGQTSEPTNTPDPTPTPSPSPSPTPKSTHNTPKPTEKDTPKPTQNTPKPTPKPTSTPNTGSSGDYIGNKNTHKFHRSTCSYLPDEHNRVYFDSRDQAINKGFDPCKKCNP